MTTRSGKTFVKYAVSSTSKFMVSSRCEYELWVRNNAMVELEPVMREFPHLVWGRLPGAGSCGAEPPPPGYTALHFNKTYEVFGDTEDDTDESCIQTAESLAVGVIFHRGDESLLQEVTSQRRFGDADNTNRDIAKKVKQRHPELTNHLAHPEAGQVYAIVPTKENADGYSPFHVAYVLLQDGTTNVTLKAFQGSGRHRPHFEMYTTTKDKGLKTFHETYMSYFTKHNRRETSDTIITIVLEPTAKALAIKKAAKLKRSSSSSSSAKTNSRKGAYPKIANKTRKIPK
jgi:hypothetical protein